MTLQDCIDSLLQELAHFDYGLCHIDHVWNTLFPYAKENDVLHYDDLVRYGETG